MKNKLENFYTGVAAPVIVNVGGLLLELGKDINSLFYKINDDFYADVNRKGKVAQVYRKGAIITTHYIVMEDSLTPATMMEVGPIKRLTFNPNNYHIPNK